MNLYKKYCKATFFLVHDTTFATDNPFALDTIFQKKYKHLSQQLTIKLAVKISMLSLGKINKYE